MQIPKYPGAVPVSAPVGIAVLLIAFCPVQAQATTIVFNTLGPGDTYLSTSGFAVVGVGALGVLEEVAAQFTAMTSGNLATVDLGLTFFSGHTPGAVNVFLYADSAGSPNNAIQTFLGSGTPTAKFGTTNNSLVSFTVAGTVPVVMGTDYWLVLKPANTDVADLWNQSITAGSMVKLSNDDSRWFDEGTPILPAFRITAQEGGAVPDGSSTSALLAIAIAVMFELNLLQRKLD